jgi:hypothetical protein
MNICKREERKLFLDHVDPICFLPLGTLLHAFLKLNTYLTFRIGICVQLGMLSHVVLRGMQVFSSFVMLSMACVFVRVL